MAAMHDKLIQSLTWAVQQRDTAHSEAEGIGKSLSNRVLSMQDEIATVLAHVEAESKEAEEKMRKAEQSSHLLSKRIAELSTRNGTLKTQLQGAQQRVTDLKRFIAQNNLLAPHDGEPCLHEAYRRSRRACPGIYLACTCAPLSDRVVCPCPCASRVQPSMRSCIAPRPPSRTPVGRR